MLFRSICKASSAVKVTHDILFDEIIILIIAVVNTVLQIDKHVLDGAATVRFAHRQSFHNIFLY